jgi:hypothetical protein
MPRDRGQAIGVVDRDDGKQVRVVWQVFADTDRAIGPVVAFRLWTFVDGEPMPVPGAGFQLRVHELPAFAAAIQTAMDRARRWAAREESAEAGSRHDADQRADRGVERGPGRDGEEGSP